MSLHPHEIQRKQWGDFLRAVFAAATKPADDASHLKDLAAAAQTRWAIPSMERPRTETVAALPPLVRAYACQKTATARAALAEALRPLTVLAATHLGVVLIDTTPRPRADLDG